MSPANARKARQGLNPAGPSRRKYFSAIMIAVRLFRRLVRGRTFVVQPVGFRREAVRLPFLLLHFDADLMDQGHFNR